MLNGVLVHERLIDIRIGDYLLPVAHVGYALGAPLSFEGTGIER